MGRPDVAALSEQFELGGHSCDHITLTRLPRSEAAEQISSNKRWLEDISGNEVKGFCYVRGKYNRDIINLVRESQFVYARTVQSFSCRLPFDPLRMPTTLQFFPHRRDVYLKNLIKSNLNFLIFCYLGRRNQSQRICGKVGDRVVFGLTTGRLFSPLGAFMGD